MNEFSIGIFENTVQSEMKEGYYSMISVLSEEEKEKIRREYLAEGKAEGKAEERAKSVRNLMQNMNLSSEEAMRMLGIPEEEQKAVLEQIGLMS